MPSAFTIRTSAEKEEKANRKLLLREEIASLLSLEDGQATKRRRCRSCGGRGDKAAECQTPGRRVTCVRSSTMDCEEIFFEKKKVLLRVRNITGRIIMGKYWSYP